MSIRSEAILRAGVIALCLMPKLPIDDRRIVQNKSFGGCRSTAFIEQCHGALQYFFGMLAGIGNCGRTAHKYRIGPIEAANPYQSADDVGKVRTENTAVNMEFVNDNVFEVRKEFLPLGVMR